MKDEISKLDLPGIRERINELDRNGMDLLRQRLDLSNQVGRFKQKNKIQITDFAREADVIKNAQQHFESGMQNKIESLMSTIMRISRENQYEILLSSDNDWELGRLIAESGRVVKAPERIACQGTLGSYSHLAAARLYPDAVLIPVQTFEETCIKVLLGECKIAFLPLENTTAGTVDEVVELLSTMPLYIVRAVSIPIHHKLLLLSGAELSGVKTVLSHPQALAQCSKFIRRMGWNAVAVENTAFAAREITERSDPSCAAIASSEAAALNQLLVADEEICDSMHNQTRFVAVSDTPVITDCAERLSISFHLTHQSGSLASVLNLFAERGLNLTKIQSRPVPDRPWEYSFWVDVAAKSQDRDAILALYQLSKELPWLKLMGWYEESAIEN